MRLEWRVEGEEEDCMKRDLMGVGNPRARDE